MSRPGVGAGMRGEHVRLGTCWFPEQWPRRRWDEDVAGMVGLGLDVVRLGEFAWAWYEPAPGALDFSGLDDAVDLLVDAGLGVMLCTPTATPPRWLTNAEPTVLSVGPDGRRRVAGSRRHTCPTAPAYRAASARITRLLAERYGVRVTAWQLDNEPGNHDSARCWCDMCEDAFRSWCRARYGDIATLNDAWGTSFWSGRYGDFAEVELPRPAMTAQNPALELAHRRFASHQVVDFVAHQRAVLLDELPHAVTCTNEYADDDFVDQAALARVHGRAAIDSYPHGTRGPMHTAFLLDLARGNALPTGVDAAATPGAAWVVEQQPGRINWTSSNAAVPPGQVHTWVWQAALHGIDLLLFFRWRAASGGQEQYHSGLLDHDGSPGVGHTDAVRAIADLRANGDLLAARRRADAAVVVDHAARWALGIEPHVVGAGHHDLVLPAYAALRRHGLEVDVVPADVDVTGYDLVVAPALHLAGPSVTTLTAAVDAGAMVLVGPRSLVRTADSGWVTEAAPLGLVERLGARVVDAGAVATWPPPTPAVEDSNGPTAATRLATVDGTSLSCGPWAETLEVVAPDARVLARHTAAWRRDLPVVVQRGGLVYVGATGDDTWNWLVGRISGRGDHGPGVEVFERAGRRVRLDHEHWRVEIG